MLNDTTEKKQGRKDEKSALFQGFSNLSYLFWFHCVEIYSHYYF